jgi:predicted nucleic acid-binding Zn ribbon protein
MSRIPRNRYRCDSCGKEVQIWHRVDNRDGYRGKYTPAKVGCPDCECYMDRVEADDG